MKLGAGVSPVVAMIDAGVNVGLGTDGAASNNDLDLWEEIRLAALVHKLKSGDPEALPAPLALDMATRMGARAVGLGQVTGQLIALAAVRLPDPLRQPGGGVEQVTGQLIAGKQADLIQVDYRKLRQQPLYDVMSHLVYVLDSQDVMTTIVAGRILMRDRQVLTLDGPALRRDVLAVRNAISAALAEQ